MIQRKAKELLDKLRRTNYRQQPDFGMDRLSERLIKVITNECKSTLLERDEHGNLKPKRYGSAIIINNLHQIARQLILNGTIIPKEVMNRIICTEGRILGINSDLYLYKGVQEDENQNMERVVATSDAVIDISRLGQEVSGQIGELHTEFAKQFIIKHLEQLPKVSRISVITQQLFHGKEDRNFLAEKFTAILRENTEYSDTIIDSTVNYHLDYMYGKATEREILKTINNGSSLVAIDKKKQKVSFKHLTDVVAAESQDLSTVIPNINNILTDLQQVYSDVETQLIAYSTDLTQLTPKEIEEQIKTVNRSSLKDSELRKYLKEDGYRHVDVGIKGKDVGFVKNQNVPKSMQKLSADIYDLVQNLESMSEEQYLQRAVQLQYRFIRIHPFPDSNGRTSRALLNMMTIPKGILIEVTKENKGDFVAAQRKTGEMLDKQGFTDILNNNQEQLLDEMERKNIDSPIYDYIKQNCIVDISKYDEQSDERYSGAPTVELKGNKTTYDNRRRARGINIIYRIKIIERKKHNIMEEVTDIKHCQPDEFEVQKVWREKFYNGRICQLIYNKNNMKTAYIYNKSSEADDGYYAPYLVYEIGKKLGINVPETEIRMVLHKDDRVATWGQTFYESTIIYDEKLGNEISWVAGDKRKFISQDGIKQTIDNHINANLQYFDEEDREQVKQELVDRTLLSLRLGISGKFDIIKRGNGETRLGPYFLASLNMFSLNEKEEWIHNQLAKNDEEFTQTIQSKYMPQYSIKANEDKISAEELVKYIYDQYPEQAQKSYEKLSKFTVQDVEGLLNECTRMSESHKKFALRFFEMRYQEFEELHCSCKGKNANQTDDKAKLEQLVKTARNIQEELENVKKQVTGPEGQQVIAEEKPGMEELQ